MAGKKVGKDSGYIFANPMVERKRKTVRARFFGLILIE